MDEGWEWDPDEIIDADFTGDPQLDQFGYQSPRRRGENLTGFTPGPNRDWLAQVKRDRQARQRPRELQQRRQGRAKLRRESPLSGQTPSDPGSQRRPGSGSAEQPQPGPVELNSTVQPGQHGAYFEVRTKRVWWLPWRKRKVWQQISTWQAGPPPAGATVVTVADVAALPGRVHTIGRVSGTGGVEY